jgi:DNA-binding GntR family transcriptional regulator
MNARMEQARDKKSSPPSASARVVGEVIRALYEGEYVPGQRLVESELMETYGVSRSIVRESIRRMESEGIVDVLPHRGAMIRRLSIREAIDALMVMEICVGLAARLAAERIDSNGNREHFEAAWQQLSEFREAPDSFDFVKARNRFYRTITDISGNRELQRIVPGIHVHLIRREYSLSSHTRFADYDRMARAILSGDGTLAESAAREHIANTVDLVKQRALEAGISLRS